MIYTQERCELNFGDGFRSVEDEGDYNFLSCVKKKKKKKRKCVREKERERLREEYL